MWKKPDGDPVTPLEFTSKQMPQSAMESVDKALVGVFLDSQSEKGKYTVSQEGALAEVQPPPSTQATMAEYAEAVSEFSKNATAFIEQLHLLTKAREAYGRAMKASVELRKVLDTGEEDLRALMTQLAQVLEGHLVKPAADKKKPEVAKVEATRGTDEGAGAAKAFP